MTSIRATVLRRENNRLLVQDNSNSQQVLVNTNKACCFHPGDLVCICYSGIMTMSIPPQIHAACITRIPSCG